jgi:hypothetical protein
MGLTLVGAIFCLALSYLALSPNFARNNRALAVRLGPRLRSLIGTALALLLMGFGFFLAGVPLVSDSDGTGSTAETGTQEVAGMGTVSADTAVSTSNITNTFNLTATNNLTPTLSNITPVPTSSTPASGAFVRPNSSEQATAEASTPTAVAAAATNQATPTPTRTPTFTPTPSPTPTVTPTPTFTPTPFDGATAQINLGGGTVWLRQSPADNAAQVELLNDGTAVRPTGRRANVAGFPWTEVQTGSGRIGWLRTNYLTMSNEQ